MEIAYDSEELRSTCLARKDKGLDLPSGVEKALHGVISAIRSADHLDELPIGQPRFEGVPDPAEWNIALDKIYRVTVRINHSKVPVADGKIALERVYRVKIMKIEAKNG